MSINLDKLKEYLESDKAKEYFEQINEKRALQEKRFKRFDAWLEENDFVQLMDRLVSEHDDDYIKSCYERGYMPYPNRKLAFVIAYVGDRYDPITVHELDCPFSNAVWQFKGYYFQMVWGQGVITKIYKKENLEPILVI